jgi:hypothetical protein
MRLPKIAVNARILEAHILDVVIWILLVLDGAGDGKAANPFHSLAALQKLALHDCLRTVPAVALPRR